MSSFTSDSSANNVSSDDNQGAQTVPDQDIQVVEDDNSEQKATSDKVKDKAKDIGNDLLNKAKQSLECAETFIKERPIASAAIALGAGVAIAYFFLKRKK